MSLDNAYEDYESTQVMTRKPTNVHINDRNLHAQQRDLTNFNALQLSNEYNDGMSLGSIEISKSGELG